MGPLIDAEHKEKVTEHLDFAREECVKKCGNGFPSAQEIIEAVTDHTAWTLYNSKEIEMAQGLSADISTEDN